MEIILALVLFVVLIACWLVLPGTTTTIATVEPTETGSQTNPVGSAITA